MGESLLKRRLETMEPDKLVECALTPGDYGLFGALRMKRNMPRHLLRSPGFQAVVLLIHVQISALDDHDASALNRRRTSPRNAHQFSARLPGRRSGRPVYASWFRVLCLAERKGLG